MYSVVKEPKTSMSRCSHEILRKSLALGPFKKHLCIFLTNIWWFETAGPFSEDLCKTSGIWKQSAINSRATGHFSWLRSTIMSNQRWLFVRYCSSYTIYIPTNNKKYYNMKANLSFHQRIYNTAEFKTSHIFDCLAVTPKITNALPNFSNPLKTNPPINNAGSMWRKTFHSPSIPFAGICPYEL